MPKYITVPVTIEPEQLVQDSYDFIRSVFPQWVPANGNLDTWILQATASEAAELMQLASQVPQAIFRYFGSSLINIQPIAASPATVSSTWFAVDALGYTIDAGTVVGLRTAGDDVIPFFVMQEIVIPPGQTQTGVGEVPLEAVSPGSAGSGLGSVGGLVELITPLVWVDHITQTDITTGGVDDELDSDYLDRLRAELQLLTPRPILPADFSALARDIPGVFRATTVDGYNPSGGTFNNERMVAVACQDSTGAACSSQVKSAVQAFLDGMREINFVVNVVDPVFKAIAVTYTIAVRPGQIAAEVLSRVNAAITDYLDPKTWGIPPEDSDPHIWENQPVVRLYEIATLINNVSGVDHIGALFIGLQGTTLTATDYTMTGGVVLLPTPGTISGAEA